MDRHSTNLSLDTVSGHIGKPIITHVICATAHSGSLDGRVHRLPELVRQSPVVLALALAFVAFPLAFGFLRLRASHPRHPAIILAASLALILEPAISFAMALFALV